MPNLISTSNTWPNYSASNVKTAAANPKTELGQDQFMALLVAQLKNQDPMSPMDNSQFIAQMAQFSSLTQLTKIGEKLDNLKGSVDTSLGASSELIGKKVTWLNEATDSKTGEKTSTYETGIVEGIVMKGGVQYAQVGADAVPLTLIAKVETATSKAAEATPAASTATQTPASTTATPAASNTSPAATDSPATTAPAAAETETASAVPTDASAQPTAPAAENTQTVPASSTTDTQANNQAAEESNTAADPEAAVS
ncbi:flagellar hook capping FlgD N-terminal domain-containing protein [Paenibacillus wulumuqiensis]|uniref:flagellar hook capping FlgD N-terminal domain-containing protein n=1 Tax=Paenibacillus wulumuqiensis TaxID=1567107 RepID=UPI000695C732|nr:flagellar hook capping FlgD N-terminal domain-containing protein [Paenibacillus wulumuqiensis]